MSSPHPALVDNIIRAKALVSAILQEESLSPQVQDMIGTVLKLVAEAPLEICQSAWAWNTMDHPDIPIVKQSNKQILVFVPRKMLVKGKGYELTRPKLAIVHWAKVPEVVSPTFTVGKLAVELESKHGGYWSMGRSNVKPLRGSPALWAHLPQVECIPETVV